MEYKTIKIGNQVWMLENLNVSCFRNGDLISEVVDKKIWSNADIEKIPAWCHYDDDQQYETQYGKLYNWYAVNDPRGLAPEGFHIPSNQEFSDLIEYLGGDKIAGKELKHSEIWFHIIPATNSSGFSALAGGSKNVNGSCGMLGHYGIFWTATESDEWDACFKRLHYDDDGIYNGSYRKTNGYSVRCIKD